MVLDMAAWKSSAAFYLELSPDVPAYVKNDHPEFSIPCYSGKTKQGVLVALTLADADFVASPRARMQSFRRAFCNLSASLIMVGWFCRSVA